MGLMDRDYMYNTYEERMKQTRKLRKREKRISEIWKIYSKNHIGLIDKVRLKILTYLNEKSYK